MAGGSWLSQVLAALMIPDDKPCGERLLFVEEIEILLWSLMELVWKPDFLRKYCRARRFANPELILVLLLFALSSQSTSPPQTSKKEAYRCSKPDAIIVVTSPIWVTIATGSFWSGGLCDVEIDDALQASVSTFFPSLGRLVGWSRTGRRHGTHSGCPTFHLPSQCCVLYCSLFDYGRRGCRGWTGQSWDFVVVFSVDGLALPCLVA